MTSDSRITRRDALKRIGGGFAAAVAAGSIPGCGDNNNQLGANGQRLQDVFKDIPLTDQYGQTFNPAQLFREKSCLVVFGYGGCPMCETISDSVAAVQQELIKQGKHVPIIVVSVQPENDRYNDKDNPMRDYIGSYYVKGVRQYQNDGMPEGDGPRRDLGEQSYDHGQGRSRDQADRILHVVCPPDAAASKELQRRLGLFSHPNQEKQHSEFITLFNNGVAAGNYRALTGHPEQPNPAIAQDIALAVPQNGRGPGG